MRAWFLRCKKRHIWLLSAAVFLAAYFLLRRSRPLMNALADHVTTPFKSTMAHLCSATEISAAEVFYLTAAAAVIFWAAHFLRALFGRGRKWDTVYRLLLTAACVGVTFYAGFCLLWGVNYHTDSFQDRSGIVARQGTVAELRDLTRRFAAELAEAADGVPRDENGIFSADRRAVLAAAPAVMADAFDEFPTLRNDDVAPKAFVNSLAMTAMDFTGFYFPYTGEANLNMDSPGAFLPATAIHEMAHQRQIASEQECNFVAIAVCCRSDDPLFRYSGLLMGYTHLANALYGNDLEACREIAAGLPDTVRSDLRANNEYWDSHHTSFTDASQKVYDAFIKTNGDPNGVKSYGMVVDMLLAYYG
ncbi:MAG: DUF3810 domain-containing protein [Oscillospiraceae bacterium]|nr:DUF3810 domain-containing protein [Oscillospiraceae bacterium]